MSVAQLCRWVVSGRLLFLLRTYRFRSRFTCFDASRRRHTACSAASAGLCVRWRGDGGALCRVRAEADGAPAVGDGSTHRRPRRHVHRHDGRPLQVRPFECVGRLDSLHAAAASSSRTCATSVACCWPLHRSGCTCSSTTPARASCLPGAHDRSRDSGADPSAQGPGRAQHLHVARALRCRYAQNSARHVSVAAPRPRRVLQWIELCAAGGIMNSFRSCERPRGPYVGFLRRRRCRGRPDHRRRANRHWGGHKAHVSRQNQLAACRCAAQARCGIRISGATRALVLPRRPFILILVCQARGPAWRDCDASLFAQLTCNEISKFQLQAAPRALT